MPHRKEAIRFIGPRRNLPLSDLKRALASAAEVDAVGIVLSHFRTLSADPWLDHIRPSLKAGCRWRLLMLSPDGDAASRRAKLQSGPDLHYQMARNMGDWSDVLNWSDEEHVPRWQLRIGLFNLDPTFHMLRADDRAWITHYLPDVRGGDSPTFEIRGAESQAFRTYARAFDYLWRHQSTTELMGVSTVISDYDGVLGDRRAQSFSDPDQASAVELIRQYVAVQDREKGSRLPPIYLCTGRGAGFVDGILNPLSGATGRGFNIAESGAKAVRGKTSFWHPLIERRLRNPGETNPDPKNLLWWFREVKPAIENWAREKGCNVEPKDFMVTLNPPTGMTVDELKREVEDLVSTVAGLRCDEVIVKTSASAVDIGPKLYDGANSIVELDKGSGVRWLAELDRTVHLESSVAVGDTGGDIPMLGIVRWPACPGNASDQVKRLVKDRKGYVAHKTEALGFVEILERYSGARLQGGHWVAP